MKFYHATMPETAVKIMVDGVIKRGWDGVYLCTDPEHACRFLVLRGIQEIAVLEVELDENEVTETHDHNEHFFGCKAYVYHKDIPACMITEVMTYSVEDE